MNETVSVIIPTLNRSSLLQRALDSVLSQTVSPNEIIVVDD
ncbi:MAG: glycosyltransferase, partial [Candidatus Marinimicrobia bacterium]|nr:glycosyltransferase [Candidatus Neomarinimicrobiota bacterium]